MKSQGRTPSEKQFEILIRMHSDNKRCLRVYYVYEKMKKFGIKPRVFLYNRIMDTLMKTEDFDLAMNVYEDFKRDVLVEESVTFMILIKGLLKNKGQASVSVYNILMDALYKTGEIQKSLSLLSEMKDYKVELDSSSYSIAICCFVEKGEIQEACSCHNKVIEMSCGPSVPAYLSLVRVLCQTGEIDAAMMLVRECLGNVESGPMEFKYALRVIHVCKESNAAKVIEVLDEMKEEGLSPSEVIFCAIIFGICKHGTLQTCKEVFAELKDRKDLAETDMVVYDEMIIEHMNKKTSDLVLSGFLWS